MTGNRPGDRDGVLAGTSQIRIDDDAWPLPPRWLSR